MTDFVPIERIANKIYLIRHIRVTLDRDLAELYGVETRALKQAVRGNIKRFPVDFMFELNEDENQALRSQNVILKRGQHSKYLPFAFTEQGVAMFTPLNAYTYLTGAFQCFEQRMGNSGQYCHYEGVCKTKENAGST